MRHRTTLNDTAKAHGLDGTLVAPDWPPLELAEVRDLLKAFPGAGQPIKIVSTSPRPFSAASIVETSSEPIFIKRHARLVRDVEGLMEEHRFIEHLRQNGMIDQRIYATSSGDTAVEMGDWTYEVHTIPVGFDLYEDAISWTPFRSIEHARSAGDMLARLHLAAVGFPVPERKARPLVSSFTIFAEQNASEGLRQYLGKHPALEHDGTTLEDCAIALTLLAPFHNDLKPLLSALRPIWTHNDLHASNLFWSGRSGLARATSVIDFG